MTAIELDCSVHDILAQLRTRYPDAPFLALGQTVFWDEPMKATLRYLLDHCDLGGQMVLGVHDTDYFAKAKIRAAGRKRFALMPHNDGTTRDLWSAAGEISTLFGSETFPRRQDYARYGVPWDRLAASYPEGKQAFLDAMTEAWGWRGLVYTGSRDLIVHHLSLREVGDGLLETLSWGFENALAQIQPGCCQDEGRSVGQMILGWCRDYRTAHPDHTLTQLFQHVLPQLYSLLLGYAPDNVTVDCTANLLRLNPATASLPRFRFVDLFLRPETRALALDAYNQAVTGSEIYTLDKFGAGALPFDAIVPERGRGTLRVTPRVLFIETRQPIAIPLKKPLESVQELAEVLTARLGDKIPVVGKAVSLVSMLAQEFIFIFNEEGSLYVRRTRQMNDLLAKQGIALDMRPILRVRYHTWDSLSVGRSTLRPTEHLAATFGQKTITTPELAANWRQVVAEQRQLCAHLATLKRPRDLMRFLMEQDAETDWEEQRTAYHAAQARLRAIHQEAASLQTQVRACYAQLASLRQQSQAVQQAKGDHYRATTTWDATQEECRAAFDRQLTEIAHQKRLLKAEVLTLKARRWQQERGPEATAARTAIRDIGDRAERARLQLIRNALLTIEGLEHTNHRPSAWWLPMVDSSGDWFRRIVQTAELYTEPLLS